ncbi:MAG: NADPH dehydrogenase [Acholeplasmataceae bacterium]
MFFEPLRIKNIELKNRSVLPPMCMYQAKEDGIVKDFHVAHYAQRALGGMALIIQEATAVTPDGRISRNDLGIWKDDHVPGLKRIVRAIKDHGSVAGIQINHAGRKAKTDHPMGPTDEPYYPDSSPKAMTIADIKDTIEAFKQAARRADEAGYDVLEIHGAHGYLIFEFLSPLTNKRTDRYADGALFLKELMQAVYETWPRNKAVILRISAYEYRKTGIQPEDVARIINALGENGPDIVHVSTGGNVPANIVPYPGYQLRYARTVRKITNKITIGGGLITDLKLAEFALQEGYCDLVFFGRALLKDANFVLNHAHEIGVDIEWPKPYERGK